MTDPLMIELPDRQGVGVRPGEVLLRFHQSGHYLFPFGNKNAQQHPANFVCPNCGTHVLWLSTKKGSSVFSCHCLVAVCGSELTDPVLVNIDAWIQWIVEAWYSQQQQLHSQAN